MSCDPRYRILYYKYSGVTPEITPIDNPEAAIIFIHNARQSTEPGGSWQLEVDYGNGRWDIWLDEQNRDANELVNNKYFKENEKEAKRDGYVHVDNGTPFVSNQKVGRNDPCPECLKKGITIKFKKCKEHSGG